jgi:two-component system invasion response regulator UvrY
MRIFFASKKKLLIEAISALLAQHNQYSMQNIESLTEENLFPHMEPGDVIILTEPSFECSTICALQKLQLLSNGTAVVLISCKTEIQSPAFLFQHSVKAVLTKDCEVGELHAAISMASIGKPYVTPTIAQQLADDLYHHRPILKLSPRETEVIGFIAKGNTTGQIAKRLCLSTKTVSAHKSSIKLRLNLGSTSEMVQYAIENNLVNP